MRIVDYSPTPGLLSWFLAAGIPIDRFLAIRQIPSFDMRGKGAVPRILPMAAFRVTHPMPAFDATFNRSFSNIMNTTAAALLAEGKPIRLAWSGGLDSTGALLALKQAGATAQQVEVRYTDDSVAEYPAFLSFIQQNFTAVKVGQVLPDTSGDALWVTGEGGNQLFFPVSASKFHAMRTKFSTPANTLPWQEFFFQQHPDWVRSGLRGANAGHRIGDGARAAATLLMNACPFPVVTVEQAQWWRVFALHWQHMAYRQGTLLAPAEFAAFAVNHRPFFMSVPWQRWSMKRMSEKVPDTDYLFIKKPLKDYIHALYPDLDYYNTKSAEGSYQLRWPANYVRFEDGSVPATQAQFLSMVAA